MAKQTILLTHPLFPDVIKKELGSRFNYQVVPYSKLKTKLKDADGLICLLTQKIDQYLLMGATHLKVIGNYAVGYDNIDLAYCKENKIKVVNTPGVLTQATAELAISLLFAVARRIPQADQFCRKGKFEGWNPTLMLGTSISGKNAVIVGKGRIGSESARLLKALGAKVEFITRSHSSLQIKAILKKAEILSIHLPLREETHHWLNETRIAMLPLNSIVINTSRGPTIDEKSLATAIQEKKIFGAGLDVFEREPKIHSTLLKSDRVVLAPHIGSATEETRKEMARLVVNGVKSILNGKSAPNEVR